MVGLHAISARLRQDYCNTRMTAATGKRFGQIPTFVNERAPGKKRQEVNISVVLHFMIANLTSDP